MMDRFTVKMYSIKQKCNSHNDRLRNIQFFVSADRRSSDRVLLLDKFCDRQDAWLFKPRRNDDHATGSPFLVLPAGTLPTGRLTSVMRKAGEIQST